MYLLAKELEKRNEQVKVLKAALKLADDDRRKLKNDLKSCREKYEHQLKESKRLMCLVDSIHKCTRPGNITVHVVLLLFLLLSLLLIILLSFQSGTKTKYVELDKCTRGSSISDFEAVKSVSQKPPVARSLTFNTKSPGKTYLDFIGICFCQSK